MSTVNMLEAKSNLSRVVESVENGTEREIIIARNGRPAAKLVPLTQVTSGQRIGLGKGKFVVPGDFDAHDDLIAALFNQGEV